MIGYDYTVLIGDKKTDGSVRNWLNNDLVPSLTILHQAETWLYRRLRIREMLTTTTGTLAADAETIPLPDRYVAPRSLFFTGILAGEIKHRRIEEVEAAFAYDSDGNRVTGRPVAYAADATVLQLDCPADQDYPWRLRYYQQLASLSSDNPSNVLTGRAFNAFHAAAMGFACRWDKEDGAESWFQQAVAHVEEINVEDDQELAATEMAVQVI